MRGQASLFKGAHRAADRESGSTDDWATPQKFYDLLHGEFGFTLDPCASADNAKCAYFDEADDGLAQDWGKNVCFVNFPYSQAKAWAAKCIDAADNGATVVVLCAARTDTGWWQSLVARADEVRFVRGRLWFQRGDGIEMSAPFPSSVIVLKPELCPSTSVALMVLWDVGEARR